MRKEDQIKNILRLLKQEYPNSKCSLDFSNPFELLVGTILSAQSTDERVNMITPNLFESFPDAKTMAKADLEEIKAHIKSIGLYNNKAKSLKNACKIIIDEYEGKIPQDIKKLQKLPGVGRKTANVVLGNAFRIPSGIAVDTHVTRLTKRMGLTTEKTANNIETDLMKIVPKDEWIDFTHLFIDHGRKICGRAPKCDSCVVSQYCEKIFD